jgi:hypothetical protein
VAAKNLVSKAMSDYLLQAIDSVAGDVAFAAIFLAIIGGGLFVLMFAGLILRRAWRWVTRRSWQDVIVSTQRKALRSR